MFVEILITHECYFPIAEKLGIPVIGTVTLRSNKLADHLVGLPNNPAVIPLERPPSKPDMNIFERFINLWYHAMIDYYYYPYIRRKVENFWRENIVGDLSHKKGVSMIFFNNHASLLPRNSPPNVVDIGGIHLAPAKPLPKVSWSYTYKLPRQRSRNALRIVHIDSSFLIVMHLEEN